jgi:hypothetical protein
MTTANIVINIIDKMNNYLSLQIIEYKKATKYERWKSMSWVGTDRREETISV